jgi:GcrA cell cycle regulator
MIWRNSLLTGAQMCNSSFHQGAHTVASSHASRAFSPVALSGMSLSTAPRVSEGRRRWTTDEVTEILSAIATLRTSDIARTLGVTPKALRSLLRRNGVSLRALRESAQREDSAESGLIVRRSSVGPSATYGAAALETLPDGACRWPHGDPAESDFFFCGAPVAGSRPYCSAHLAQAFRQVEGQ